MRRTRRRAQTTRGAAMAEALISISFMILVWAGIDYFRAGYARKLAAIADSQKEAWTKANDRSCFNGQSPLSGLGDVFGGGAEQHVQDAASQFKDPSSSVFLYANAVGKGTSRASDSKLLNLQATSTANTIMLCNEAVSQDDQNVFSPLKDFFMSLLGGFQ